MGGNPADVFGFHLMLSIGDISKDDFVASRQQAINALWSSYPNDPSDDGFANSRIAKNAGKHWCAALAETTTSGFRLSCAMQWNRLQAENAPLRAMLNGKLASVPKTIYDDFILREIARESDEFYEVNLIGNVLGTYQLGIGDAWIAHRIEKMIHDGTLTAISTPPKDRPIYHRRLKRNHTG